MALAVKFSYLEGRFGTKISAAAACNGIFVLLGRVKVRKPNFILNVTS